MRRQESVRNYNIPISALPASSSRTSASSRARSVLPRAVSGIRSSHTICRGNFVHRQSRGAVLPNSQDVPLAISRHDAGDDLLTASCIRRAQDANVRDRRHRTQDLLHLLGLDFSSGDVDEGRDAAGQHQVAFSIEPAEVTCQEAAVDERSVGRILADIARSHRLPGHVHTPSFRRSAFLRPQRHRHARQWPSDRRFFSQVFPVVVGNSAGLARAVERVDLDAERLEEPAHGPRFETGAGTDQFSQSWRPSTARRCAGQMLEHERHAGKCISAIRAGVAEERMRDETFPEDHGGAAGERRHQKVSESVGMRQRNGRELCVLRADVHGPEDLIRVDRELLVGREGRFGQPCRSGCQFERRCAAIEIRAGYRRQPSGPPAARRRRLPVDQEKLKGRPVRARWRPSHQSAPRGRRFPPVWRRRPQA